MSRREAWLSVTVVFGVAVLVRAWAATQITFPRPEDVAYYVHVARNLLEGRGLTADVIWSYATPPLVFPRPAFEIWLPLPTFLMAIPMALFGHTFAAAQVASVIEGSAVAVLGWRLAADVAAERGLSAARARWLALGTGLAAAVYLPLVLSSVQPDSTMPFAVLVLGATLVMRRILDSTPITPLLLDRRAIAALAGLGVLLGLAGLTRNEAIWLALAWAILAWRSTRWAGPLGDRFRAALPLIGIPAVVSVAVYAPWAMRDWAEFGTPLPGQAIANALLLSHQDLFAWASPPTLERYLAVGLPALVGQRVDALFHDLGTVLLLLGVPASVIGLVGLPWTARGATLRPLVVFSLATFLVATLAFPVATLAGTFLHAAGAIHVLVVLSALVVLDALVERVRVARAWTRPVAWIGPLLAVAGGALLGGTLLLQDGAGARAVAARYAALPGALSEAGAPLPADGSPVISDHPIWLATEDGVRAIALPDESPADVLDLAKAFGAGLLVMEPRTGALWPRVLDPEEPGAECFRPVPLAPSVPLPPSEPADPLADLVVFQIVCTLPLGQGQQ